MRFDLSDEDWALLEPLLPKSRKSARVDDRKIMNAIFYVLRTGMPWRDLPARYGPYAPRGLWFRSERWGSGIRLMDCSLCVPRITATYENSPGARCRISAPNACPADAD